MVFPSEIQHSEDSHICYNKGHVYTPTVMCEN